VFVAGLLRGHCRARGFCTSRIYTAGIIKPVNQELGINLEATTVGWQRGLDRLESDLVRPRHRYSDLNRLRQS
jgi:hypothetical protein